jgi:salicylate hydroxylase
MDERHRRWNVDVDREKSQFSVLPGVGRPIDEYGRFVPTNLDSEESWTAAGDLKELGAEYADWDDPVPETIGALNQTFRWGIYDRAPLPYWSTGRMTLLGDAVRDGK